ncbi:hypothetical protein Tco_1343578 [Tanacetum coccineum]
MFPQNVRIRQKSQENRQKRANTDTRTEERARAGSQSQKGKTRGFSKLKVQKSNSRVQDQDGKVNTSSEVLIGGNPQGECHVTMKKAQGMGIFTFESLSEKAQGVTSRIATLAIRVCTYAIQRPKVDIQ